MPHSGIIACLTGKRFNLHDEKILQSQIAQALGKTGAKREYYLDGRNIVDFFLDGLVIEVKIKGSSKAIYKQCERYCAFGHVEELMLVTNKAMGFPPTINGKPCYVFNLGKAWL